MGLDRLSILRYNCGMRNQKGQFTKGHHWRERRPYWDKAWLEREYLDNQRTAPDIAAQFGVTDNNILYFLHKHGIPCRTTTETRAIKHWGSSGPDNGMYGVTGADNPNWKGGITPERQALYSSHDWARIVIDVWVRDNATCQRCGKQGGQANHRTVHIHHKASFDEYPELRLELDNVVLLCSKCHGWVHSKKNVNGEWKGGEDVATG